jgi:glutamate dehydrogenase/leucine dehydrogenase/CBS domain-containing protein
MIPKQMESFLRGRLPESTWQNRLTRDGDRCFMEFSAVDTERLARLGIETDKLGPRLVVCMWDEASELEIGGYLVIDNLAMGRPSMGGIRVLPELTPATIHNLARGMTLKNAAARLPFGGGKVGIIAERKMSPDAHRLTMEGFARLLHRYKDIYLPGPDVGTNDADMKTVAIWNGIDHAVSKPAEMGGNQVDQQGAAAGGLVIALEALLDEMPRLQVLPQFSNCNFPDPGEISILIQGFGAVGANTARILKERLPDSRVIGVSDMLGYLFTAEGLPVEQLFQTWQEKSAVTRTFFQNQILKNGLRVKYSNSPDDLLRESAFCLIPASPITNYIDTDPTTNPCITVEEAGNWSVIIEGANIYSPDPARRALRNRMERSVYRQKGTLIASDFLVNSGSVIYAAQEQLIKTPMHLRIPENSLGKRDEVDRWLELHSSDMCALAEQRRQAAEIFRNDVIRRNMKELIDLLISDADLLPSEAAEGISIRRIASRESDRTAAELMIDIPTITADKSVRDAANLLVNDCSSILAVVTPTGELVGVITEWDITRATALGSPDNQPLERIMTRKVITVKPDDTILEMIRKLEYHEISAMPVVDQGIVAGMITADLLAKRSLLRLLQSQVS